MTSTRFVARAVGVAAAIGFLAGCAGISPQSAVPGMTASSASHLGIQPMSRPPSPNFIGGVLKVHPSHEKSWMSPKSIPDNLLYVADTGAGRVNVYSWRLLKQVGAITGLLAPYTFCVDSAQDVYVTDYAARKIREYTHGGTSPIKTLVDANGPPIACAVDPTSGNLAVTNLYDFNGSGGVLVYFGAKGTPTKYTAPNIYYYWFAAFDPAGNFYVDGESSGSTFAFDMVKKGSSSFTPVTLPVTIGYPGAIAWDGKYVAVGDQSNNKVYQLSISGSNATLEGTTALRVAGAQSDIFQFFIPKFGQGNGDRQAIRIAGADYASGAVDRWLYPQGGFPMKTVTHLVHPEGVAVSTGKKP